MDDPMLEAMNKAADEMTPEDIKKVVAYLRGRHQAYLKGEKPTKADAGPDLMNALKAIGVELGPKVVGIRRRI